MIVKEKKIIVLLKILKELLLLPETGWGSITIHLQNNEVVYFETKTTRKPKDD